MKKIAKLMIVSLVVIPMTCFVGCSGKKCGESQQKLHKMKKEHGGK